MNTTMKLPPNTTYEHRVIHFNRVSEPGSLVVGVLQVEESTSANAKVKTRRYAVQELEPDLKERGRRFQLTKPMTDPKEPGEKHFVFYSTERTKLHRCTCRAADCGRHCVHIASIGTLATAGHMPYATPVATPPTPPTPPAREPDMQANQYYF